MTNFGLLKLIGDPVLLRPVVHGCKGNVFHQDNYHIYLHNDRNPELCTIKICFSPSCSDGTPYVSLQQVTMHAINDACSLVCEARIAHCALSLSWTKTRTQAVFGFANESEHPKKSANIRFREQIQNGRCHLFTTPAAS